MSRLTTEESDAYGRMGYDGRLGSRRKLFWAGMPEYFAVGSPPYGELHSTVDQTFSLANTSQVITFNDNAILNEITHSETVNPENITIEKAGTYKIDLSPQLDRSSTASAQTLVVWAEIDTGSGFVVVPLSAVKKSATNVGTTGITMLSILTTFAAGDILRFRAQVTDTTLFLNYTAPSGDIPAIASCHMMIHRVGST